MSFYSLGEALWPKSQCCCLPDSLPYPFWGPLICCPGP